MLAGEYGVDVGRRRGEVVAVLPELLLGGCTDAGLASVVAVVSGWSVAVGSTVPTGPPASLVGAVVVATGAVTPEGAAVGGTGGGGATVVGGDDVAVVGGGAVVVAAVSVVAVVVVVGDGGAVVVGGVS